MHTQLTEAQRQLVIGHQAARFNTPAGVVSDVRLLRAVEVQSKLDDEDRSAIRNGYVPVRVIKVLCTYGGGAVGWNAGALFAENGNLLNVRIFADQR